MNKKFISFLALLISCCTYIMAQEVTDDVIVSHSAPITDLSQLQSGQTVLLFDNCNVETRTGSLYLKDNSNNIHVNQYRPADDALGSKNYVWIVKKISENSYTFESYARKSNYIKTTTNGSAVPLASEPSTFTITPTDVSGNWNISCGKQYFNGNDRSTAVGGFTFWSDPHPYQIYPVTMGELTKNTWTITVESYIDDATSATDTYTSQVFEGQIWLHRPDRIGKTLEKAEVVQNGETKIVAEGEPVDIYSNATIKYYYKTSTSPQVARYLITSTSEFNAQNIKWQKIICDRRTADNGTTVEHNGLCYYNSTDKNIKADAMTINVDNTDDKYYFAFVSDDNGTNCIIYNKAATDNNGLIPLIYTSDMPKFIRNENGSTTQWTLYADNSQRDFAISITPAGETTTYWDNAVPVIKYWASGVENGVIKSGNKFHVETLKETLDGFAQTADNWVNALSNDKKEAFKKIYGNEDGIAFETYKTAIDFARNSENQLQMENGFYRLRNYSRSFSNGNTQKPDEGGYLEYTDAVEDPTFATNNPECKFYANGIVSNRIGTIWKASVNENKQFTLYNGNGGKYIKAGSTNNANCAETANAEEAELFSSEGLPWGRSKIYLANNSGEFLHITAGNQEGTRLILWNDGSFNGPSAWYIEKVEDIDLLISSAGYSTAMYPYAIQIPEGVKVYYASEFNGESVTLTLINNIQYLPANMPVILEGKPGAYSAPLIFDESIVPTKETLLNNQTNYLEGTLLMNNIPETNNVYVLANKNEGMKFYQLEANSGNRKVSQNKAYLVASPSAANIKSFNMQINDNTTTQIDAITNNKVSKETKYYDLNGRRVITPKKGIYITSEGKKVLFF